MVSTTARGMPPRDFVIVKRITMVTYSLSFMVLLVLGLLSGPQSALASSHKSPKHRSRDRHSSAQDRSDKARASTDLLSARSLEVYPPNALSSRRPDLNQFMESAARSPATLAALRSEVAQKVRMVKGETKVRGRDGEYLAILSSVIYDVPASEVLDSHRIVAYDTTLSIYGPSSELADEIIGLDRGGYLAALSASPTLDWISVSTALDGELLFELEPGGKLLLILENPEQIDAPNLNVVDLGREGSYAIVLPAVHRGPGHEWLFLTASELGNEGYAWRSELVSRNSDGKLRPSSHKSVNDWSAGVFVIDYPYLESGDDIRARHRARIEYWTPELAQWKLLVMDRQAARNADNRRRNEAFRQFGLE